MFLSVFDLRSSLARKNPPGVVEAFRKAFGDDSGRLLVLKIGGILGNDASRATLIESVAGLSNVRVLEEVLPADSMTDLIASVDVIVSLHRSEGFGLIPAQGMLAGKPVLVTDWSGTREFTVDEIVAPIPYRLVRVTDPQGIYSGDDQYWAEPDIDAAAGWMRRLADSDSLRTHLGRCARRLSFLKTSSAAEILAF